MEFLFLENICKYLSELFDIFGNFFMNYSNFMKKLSTKIKIMIAINKKIWNIFWKYFSYFSRIPQIAASVSLKMNIF